MWVWVVSRGTRSWGKAAVAVTPEHAVTFSLCRTVLGQHGDRARYGQSQAGDDQTR